jgi:hypothetical protein
MSVINLWERYRLWLENVIVASLEYWHDSNYQIRPKTCTDMISNIFPDRNAPSTVRSCVALMLTHILISIATTIPIATLFTPPAQAEIPPGSYDKLRIGAEEALIIKVIKVNKKLSSNREVTLISVKAMVVAVQRSKKGIKPGREISIVYESQNPNSTMTGPRRIGVLEEGAYYPAFLNISDNQKTYRPAAYGESFKMTPDN